MAYGTEVKAFAKVHKGLGYVRDPGDNGYCTGTTIQADVEGKGSARWFNLTKNIRSDEFVLELMSMAFRMGEQKGRNDQIQETRDKYLAFVDSFSGRADYE